MSIKLVKKINKKVKRYWGYDSLKDKQMEIITNFINKKDVIGLLPTGYGKSMCYLIPPLVKKKVIFIISPLISLMEDQKEKLVEMEIPVACLHGNNFNKDKEIFEIIDGNINIVYMSPEFLIRGDGLELAKSLDEEKRLGFLAVDESHCISVWGHDFRSEYLKIKNFRIKFPKIPFLAVTATATFKVINEIAEHLTLKEPILVRANFDRPNLYLKCVKVETTDPTEIVNSVGPFLTKYRHSKIIIYTNSRKDCVDYSDRINKKYGQGDKKYSLAYHAGMSKSMRHRIQTSFSNGDSNIIVSTVAFGMGIDQIVRCVLIFGAPSSIEDYYQQIGRAGRDTEPAETVLFFQYKNIVIGKHMCSKKSDIMSKEVIDNKKKCLDIMAKYFYTNGCRRRYILDYFGQIPKFFCCNNCDNCCERELKNYTKKLKKLMFSDSFGNKIEQSKLIEEIFNSKDINRLVDNDLIKDFSARNYQYKYIICQNLLNWKKVLEVNKKVDKIPEKYKIKLAK